jgi:hypothetical protein
MIYSLILGFDFVNETDFEGGSDGIDKKKMIMKEGVELLTMMEEGDKKDDIYPF